MTPEERWNALKTYIKGYILFDKIDRHAGNLILSDMEQLEEK